MVVGEFTESVDLVVVGGGPGGYVAAIRAAQLGRSVTLIERDAIGGVCLNVGCIPSKALISVADELDRIHHSRDRGLIVGSVEPDIVQIQVFKDGVVKKLTAGVDQLLKANGVSVIEGEARFVDRNHLRIVSEYESKKMEFNHAIIATGSRPRVLKEAPIDGQVILGSTEILSLSRIPEHLVVIGGGYIGIEMATAWRKFGSRVTVIEMTPGILPGIERGLVRVVERRLKELGVDIATGARIGGVEVSGDTARVSVVQSETSETLTCDAMLVTVGRVPNTDALDLHMAGISTDDRGQIRVDSRLRTENPLVAAIGDVVKGPMLAHKASYEGKIAAESLSGLPSEVDVTAIPAVIFSDPEIATVGLSEERAQAEGYTPIMGRFPFQANGRALSLGQPLGEAVVVADQATGLLLGVGIVGVEASTLIAEGTLGIEMGATLEDIALTIHAHPTIGETLVEAVEVALGRPIHVAPRRRS